jgi:hypothetical protein
MAMVFLFFIDIVSANRQISIFYLRDPRLNPASSIVNKHSPHFVDALLFFFPAAYSSFLWP